MMNRGNSSEWESGWDIFTDWDRDEAIADVGNDCGVEGQDCWLRRQAALENGFTVRTGGPSPIGLHSVRREKFAVQAALVTILFWFVLLAQRMAKNLSSTAQGVRELEMGMAIVNLQR